MFLVFFVTLSSIAVKNSNITKSELAFFIILLAISSIHYYLYRKIYTVNLIKNRYVLPVYFIFAIINLLGFVFLILFHIKNTENDLDDLFIFANLTFAILVIYFTNGTISMARFYKEAPEK